MTGILTVYLILFLFYTDYNFDKSAKSAKSANIVNYTAFDNKKKILESYIKSQLETDFQDYMIRDICAYALAGGKKVRSVITYAVAPDNLGLEASLIVEYIHAASLVVDDIMDKDDFRRGKLTVAAKYGTNAAYLAAMQLLSTAFRKSHGLVSKMKIGFGIERANEIGVAMFGALASKLHILGVGQYMDMNPFEVLDSEDVIHKKTSSLFELAFLNGWYARNGDLEKQPDVSAAAMNFGLLFQIVDDIDDCEKDISKNPHTINFAARWGYQAALERCEELQKIILEQCRILNIEIDEIQDILNTLVQSAREKIKCSKQV